MKNGHSPPPGHARGHTAAYYEAQDLAIIAAARRAPPAPGDLTPIAPPPLPAPQALTLHQLTELHRKLYWALSTSLLTPPLTASQKAQMASLAEALVEQVNSPS